MINNTELNMNARLKELKLMALEKFASNHGLELTHLGDLDPRSQEEVDGLFSEMIIRECASTATGFSKENKRFHPDIHPVNMSMDHRMVYHSTCQSVAYEIKERFGVDEPEDSTCPDCGADGGTQCGSINCGY
jgi:hypothetical protein